MARIIVRTEHGPKKVDAKGKEIFICRCGLTQDNTGQCDKSHKKTLDEDDHELYMYKDDGTREKLNDCDDECDCDGGCHPDEDTIKN